MVDFTLTAEQDSIRDMAHDFAEKEIRPLAESRARPKPRPLGKASAARPRVAAHGPLSSSGVIASSSDIGDYDGAGYMRSGSAAGSLSATRRRT